MSCQLDNQKKLYYFLELLIICTGNFIFQTQISLYCTCSKQKNSYQNHTQLENMFYYMFVNFAISVKFAHKRKIEKYAKNTNHSYYVDKTRRCL